MNIRDRRIGYAPYDPNLTRPGDSRRFVYYARKRELNFEVAKLNENYDVVVVTPGSDITAWAEYERGNTRIIYDQVDAYLAIPDSDVKGLLRGPAKYVCGQHRKLMSYWEAIRRMCRRADAVICSTNEQKQSIVPFCPKVHIILDFLETAIRAIKTDYSAGDTFNFVWEGLPGNLEFFSLIRPVLERLQRNRRMALHVVTALEYGRYLGGRYGRRNTLQLARNIMDKVYLYSWNEQMLSRIVTACDMALIPLAMDNALVAGKPENKLVGFWRMGMPVIVSATPAYSRAMCQSGVQMACHTLDEWESTLDHYMGHETERRDAGQRGKVFAEANYGEALLLFEWDHVLGSVLGQSGPSVFD